MGAAFTQPGGHSQLGDHSQLGGPSQLHLGGFTQDALGGASQGMGLGFPVDGMPSFQGFTQEARPSCMHLSMLPLGLSRCCCLEISTLLLVLLQLTAHQASAAAGRSVMRCLMKNDVFHDACTVIWPEKSAYAVAQGTISALTRSLHSRFLQFCSMYVFQRAN